MWLYTLGVLILWVVNPELRRLFEWKMGYATVDFFPLLPFLSVVPHLFSLTYGGGWRRLPRVLVFAAWLWIGSFAYAYMIAIVCQNALPGAYTFANFVLPIVVGLWLAANPASLSTTYERIYRLLFALTTVISIYGVVQYVVAPEWDRLWLQHVINAGSLSFGRPEPFQIRVFSMLGSPGPFGNFMALMLLLALPRLSLRRPWALTQLAIWLVAFGLSLDRTGWLLFAVGALVYLLMTSRRVVLVATLVASGSMLCGLMMVLPAIIGNDSVLTNLNDRLATFSDLDRDHSGDERRNLYDSTISAIIQAPFGQGLGVVGTATKLGQASTTTDFDSGILARFLEMGIPGATLFFAALSVLAAGLFKNWREGLRSRSDEMQSLSAMAFALSLALVASETSGDVSGLQMLILWLVCGIVLRSRATSLDVGAIGISRCEGSPVPFTVLVEKMAS